MFQIGGVQIGLNNPCLPLFVIAGPCVIESEAQCLSIANRLKEISQEVKIPVIFKASFDKANRSSHTSYRGPGIYEGLNILREVRIQTGLPVITDIHNAEQANFVVNCDINCDDWVPAVDCIQIPALLCKQTDLVCAAAQTGLPINVKKGQFMSPLEMTHVINKISQYNNKFMITERGTFFGYNHLINDMTAIRKMQGIGTGCPVVFDATHSIQQYGSNCHVDKRDAETLALAAVAAGANGLFFEVFNQHISKVRCDKATSMPIDWLETLLPVCKDVYGVVN